MIVHKQRKRHPFFPICSSFVCIPLYLDFISVRFLCHSPLSPLEKDVLCICFLPACLLSRQSCACPLHTRLFHSPCSRRNSSFRTFSVFLPFDGLRPSLPFLDKRLIVGDYKRIVFLSLRSGYFLSLRLRRKDIFIFRQASAPCCC